MNGNTVELPATLRDEIIAHARAGKPEEICGIIRGRKLVAHAVVRGQNVAADKINNYDVDPQTLLLQFKFEESGDEMMGIYHSHPVSPAYPSATDAWNAHYPDCIYFICSLENDDAPTLRAFRLIPHFTEFDVAAISRSVEFYETRPGLFAYYLEQDQAILPALRDIFTAIPTPAYVVYSMDGEEADTRVVHIEEVPISVH